MTMTDQDTKIKMIMYKLQLAALNMQMVQRKNPNPRTEEHSN